MCLEHSIEFKNRDFGPGLGLDEINSLLNSQIEAGAQIIAPLSGEITNIIEADIDNGEFIVGSFDPVNGFQTGVAIVQKHGDQTLPTFDITIVVADEYRGLGYANILLQSSEQVLAGSFDEPTRLTAIVTAVGDEKSAIEKVFQNNGMEPTQVVDEFSKIVLPSSITRQDFSIGDMYYLEDQTSRIQTLWPTNDFGFYVTPDIDDSLLIFDISDNSSDSGELVGRVYEGILFLNPHYSNQERLPYFHNVATQAWKLKPILSST